MSFCSWSRADSAIPCSGTALMLASVFGHLSLPVDVALFERQPFAGSEAGRGCEEHDRAESGAEFGRDRVQFIPGLEGSLFGAATLWVVDPLLCRVDLDEIPTDGAGEHLPQRLRCL